MDTKNIIDKFVKSLGGLSKLSATTLAIDLPAKDGIRYGGFTKRVYAFGIDSVAIIILFLPLMFILPSYQIPVEITSALTEYKSGNISEEQYYEAVAPYASDAISNFIKFGLRDTLLIGLVVLVFWFYKAATPGKMIFGMEIVDAKTHGKPTKKQLFIRYIGYFISTIFFGLGFLWVAFDKRKRGWHDIMAGTVVIYPKPLDADWQSQLFKRNTYVVVAFLIIAAIWFYFFNK